MHAKLMEFTAPNCDGHWLNEPLKSLSLTLQKLAKWNLHIWKSWQWKRKEEFVFVGS